jgi:polyferredoxin
MFLLGFLALFLAIQYQATPPHWANLFLRLDPLVSLAHLLSSRTFLLATSLGLLTLLTALLVGRAWCGWVCPLGTLLDIFSFRKLRGNRKPPPEAWRGLKFYLALAILVAALFGNLSLLILDPLTLLVRGLTVGVWPVIDRLVTLLERSLYQIPWLSEPVTRLDNLLRPALLPAEPAVYAQMTLFFLVFLGVFALNILAPRFWCRYLCPLGGLLAFPARLSLFQRRVKAECKGCQLCTRACPTGTIRPEQNYASDPGECTLCLDCLEACPRSAVAFTPPALTHPLFRRDYDLDRRQALYTLGATLVGVACLRLPALTPGQHPYLLQPPGGRENDLLDKCVRCGLCLRACPTSALQPALAEAGIEGLWSPVLTPRRGYCEYSCNACGQICPVQAIPALDLEQKRQQVIGVAVINTDRCIAWAEHTDCIVCEEMCPVPHKAIYLEEKTYTSAETGPIVVKLPRVETESCIGCGICEYKCPVAGESAIRVTNLA